MAQININEISQSYSYNIGTNAYCTVAMPITSCWGPGYFDKDKEGLTEDEILENLRWEHFSATQEGLESFVSTYRGPASNYRSAKDFSYQMAMTLLTAGYDVLACRVCPGTRSEGDLQIDEGNKLHMKAKYPGTFGNNLRCAFKKARSVFMVDGKTQQVDYWNMIVYVLDASGVKTAVENLNFVFEIANSNDSLYHISEIESNFVQFSDYDSLKDTLSLTGTVNVDLAGGSDSSANDEISVMIKSAGILATLRYQKALGSADGADYVARLSEMNTNDENKAAIVRYKEWVYNAAYSAMDKLKDKLSYNYNRIAMPGWDDQDFSFIVDNYSYDDVNTKFVISPLHIRMMDVAYNSRCGTAYIDIPKSLPRSRVWNEKDGQEGYAQMLARFQPDNTSFDLNASLYTSHSALFAPWGNYIYVGTSKQNEASPSFMALMIERAMILNQSSQYEWALPTTRRHNLKIGKLAYSVNKHLLDDWQGTEGVGVNVITDIPDMGMSLWGNSTLFEVPVATYQALANLSTRKLVNAVEDQAYRCGINITFQYNNEDAYSSFYAGMTPLLDTMKYQGAIEDYYIKMSADINGLDRVNLNSVIGKIYLTVNGVINDINIDLIALPSVVNLDDYRAD